MVASLLGSRALCAGLGGAAFLHVVLVATGAGGWPCPVMQGLGIPCPGCGLGRACSLLLKGEVVAALRIHAFAPFALLAVALFSLAAVIPAERRLAWARSFESMERRWPLAPVLLGGMILYWLLRFCLDATGFVQLLK